MLNGSKMWITNSYEAEVFLIFANVSVHPENDSIEFIMPRPQVDPSKGYKGITCFIATKDMGIQIAKKEQKLGIRASSTCLISLDDLRVPAENIIGGEGKGYKVSTFYACAHCTDTDAARPTDRDRVSERGPHRHCRADAWACAGRIRQGGAVHVPADAVRATGGHVPGARVPAGARGDGDRGRSAADVQRGAAQGRR